MPNDTLCHHAHQSIASTVATLAYVQLVICIMISFYAFTFQVDFPIHTSCLHDYHCIIQRYYYCTYTVVLSYTVICIIWMIQLFLLSFPSIKTNCSAHQGTTFSIYLAVKAQHFARYQVSARKLDNFFLLRCIHITVENIVPHFL